jgi:hypothetical protein
MLQMLPDDAGVVIGRMLSPSIGFIYYHHQQQQQHLLYAGYSHLYT